MTLASLERLAVSLCTEVPTGLVEPARWRLLDFLVALGATRGGDEAGRAQASVAALAPTGTVPLVVLPGRTSPFHAAHTWARLARSSEVDDLHLGSCTTPGAVVLPALLAAASFGGPIDISRYTAAAAAGYEAVARLGAAISGPRLLAAGIWPTLAVAPLGAAVTVARALGGGPSEVRAAMARAGPMVALGRPADEAARWLAFGGAVAGGVAAGLAAMDERGAEARGGLDWTDRLPVPFALAELEPDGATFDALGSTTVKPFCVAGQAAAAVALAAAYRGELLGGPPARHIVAWVPSQVLDMVSRMPQDRLTSLSSVPLGVAHGLLEPERLFEGTRGARLAEGAGGLGARLAEMMGRVEVRADERLSADFPRRWGGRLTVTREDGGELELREGEAALGPPRGLGSLEAKARKVVPGFSAGASGALREACARFEELGGLIGELEELLGGDAPAARGGGEAA